MADIMQKKDEIRLEEINVRQEILASYDDEKSKKVLRKVCWTHACKSYPLTHITHRLTSDSSLSWPCCISSRTSTVRTLAMRRSRAWTRIWASLATSTTSQQLCSSSRISSSVCGVPRLRKAQKLTDEQRSRRIWCSSVSAPAFGSRS